MLLVLGVAAVSLCNTEAAARGSVVSAPIVSVQGEAETAPSSAHGEGHCDEAATVLADQRTGSLSSSVLLGLGVFAFVPLPVLRLRPSPAPRTSRRHPVLPLGGSRALVSLCVRRV